MLILQVFAVRQARVWRAIMAAPNVFIRPCCSLAQRFDVDQGALFQRQMFMGAEIKLKTGIAETRKVNAQFRK